MTDQEKPGLKPLCDREHGPMERAMLTIDGTDLIPAVRCTFPGCNRVYTPALGYRDLDGQNPEEQGCDRPAMRFASPLHVRRKRNA
jgi:hypothetical protein